MYDLVADVEQYPDFLPHCAALRVVRRDLSEEGGEIVADMVVAYRAFRERFKSHVVLDARAMTIETTYLDGPFRKLHNFWRFTDNAHGSLVDFTIDFEFRSLILQATAATVFERAFAKMSDAFIDRADAIYGAGALT